MTGAAHPHRVRGPFGPLAGRRTWMRVFSTGKSTPYPAGNGICAPCLCFSVDKTAKPGYNKEVLGSEDDIMLQAPGSLRSAPQNQGVVLNPSAGKNKTRGDTTMFEDKTLVCKDCGKEFVWTAGEQEFYASRGFENQPQRCKACRDARKNGARPASTGERKMYDAVCASCGKACKVPFQPREDRPV